MKQTYVQLSNQYEAALAKLLKQGPQANMVPALKLGRQAVHMGLETLDLARIHEAALVKLQLASMKNAFTKLAGMFFTEANTAIEETHRVARQSKLDLGRLMTKLQRRTQQLANSNLECKHA